MFELLLEARELYLQDVILNGKRYDRYVDDFINSHRYINCNSAICRNCHEMNILLMDEPSNFLDIPSLEALEILMKEYAGTIVFITHDKRLLENVADVVYEIRDKKINLKH